MARKGKRDGWPAYVWDGTRLLKPEWEFVVEAGLAAGAARHLSREERAELETDILVDDVLASLDLEGEAVAKGWMTERIRAKLGLSDNTAFARSRDYPAAEIACLKQRRADAPITAEYLEELVVRLEKRVFPDGRPEALLRRGVIARRAALLSLMRWYGGALAGGGTVSPLVHAGLAHLWLEDLHPFTSCNGFIGRELAAKALLAGSGEVGFMPLSSALVRDRGGYFCHLDEACRSEDATEWLLWFATAAIAAMRHVRVRIGVVNEGRRLEADMRGRVTPRQSNLLRRFAVWGVAGSKRMSVSGCSSLSGMPAAEVAVDLANLAGAGALERTVRGKTVRYRLNLPGPVIDDEVRDVS